MGFFLNENQYAYLINHKYTLGILIIHAYIC